MVGKVLILKELGTKILPSYEKGIHRLSSFKYWGDHII